MACGGLLANADAAAFRIMYHIVFNDPALAPVSTQKARLVSSRRCPGAGSLCHLKAAHGDIIHASFFRVEAALTHIDLGQLFVGISSLEIGVNICIFMVCLSIPLINGPLFIFDGFRVFGPRRVVSLCADLGISHLIQGFCFVERFAV